MSSNENLHGAKREKKDEFYTQLTDIEKELRHYRDYFRGKTILCNCGDSRSSNFFKYFSLQFEHLKLKKLVAISYKNRDPDANYGDSAQAITVTYEGDQNDNRRPDPEETTITLLKGDGDFRSTECIEYLKEADVVVTNPPFSLFREYLAQLIEYGKKFVIIGPRNAVTYKEVFPLIKDGKVWIGHGFKAGNAFFATPYPKEFAQGVYNEETGLVKFRNVIWFTNLDVSKRHEDLLLYRTYKGSEDKYPKYDNYDAIEVSRVENIPLDYYGVMGVPITFLDKHCPAQFEIVGLDDHRLVYPAWRGRGPGLNGKPIYRRIIIRRIDQCGSHGGDRV